MSYISAAQEALTYAESNWDTYSSIIDAPDMRITNQSKRGRAGPNPQKVILEFEDIITNPLFTTSDGAAKIVDQIIEVTWFSVGNDNAEKYKDVLTKLFKQNHGSGYLWKVGPYNASPYRGKDRDTRLYESTIRLIKTKFDTT